MTTSRGNRVSLPPLEHELEISVFGPGFGECILLHLGDGKWAVVDSCLDAATKEPAALAYLKSLGVDPGKSVFLLIATHWHDDHLKGIGKIFKESPNAVFVCSQGVNSEIFQNILASWEGIKFFPGGSGVEEFRGILDILKERSTGTRWPSPKLASAGKSLWPTSNRPNPLNIKITALSPSDTVVLAAISRLEELVPKSGEPRRKIPNPKENNLSVVLSVEAGGHRILLGADLLASEDRGMGWLALVDDQFTPNVAHQTFKIPHHGSHSAHHEEVWEKLLIQQPFAVTTPFVNGNIKLPSVKDCERILAKTANVFLSAPPVHIKFKDTNRTVERTIQEATRSANVVPGKYGHVRFRKFVADLPSSPWRVELFGSAVSVKEYLDTHADDR